MPPINVFTNAAINPVKASTVTPETSSSPGQDGGSNPPASRTTSNSEAKYPPAPPGIAAVSGPTTAASGYASTFVQATSTVTLELPHAPQPGAFPMPFSSSNIVPSPKTGGAYVQRQRTEAAPTPQCYHGEMHVPPPTTPYRAQPIASTTSSTTTPLSSHTVPFPTSQYEDGRRQSSLEGPPGYSQDPYAADLSAEQRQAIDIIDSDGRSSDKASTGMTCSGGDAWTTAKNWALKAGEKLSEAETEVWKRINK